MFSYYPHPVNAIERTDLFGDRRSDVGGKDARRFNEGLRIVAL